MKHLTFWGPTKPNYAAITSKPDCVLTLCVQIRRRNTHFLCKKNIALIIPKIFGAPTVQILVAGATRSLTFVYPCSKTALKTILLRTARSSRYFLLFFSNYIIVFGLSYVVGYLSLRTKKAHCWLL
jgi:hypothetical protein